MTLFKIFPAAAGVIALTATVCFAREQRNIEEDDFCRTMIANCNSTANSHENSIRLPSTNKGKDNGNVYVVEIARGANTWLVSIDAYTGKVLELHDLGVASL